MANLGTMFLLRGGPRAGQLVDDLPPGYSLLAEHTNGPSQFLVGDIVAAVAVWSEPGGMPPSDAER